jgi:hypothetical protein
MHLGPTYADIGRHMPDNPLSLPAVARRSWMAKGRGRRGAPRGWAGRGPSRAAGGTPSSGGAGAGRIRVPGVMSGRRLLGGWGEWGGLAGEKDGGRERSCSWCMTVKMMAIDLVTTARSKRLPASEIVYEAPSHLCIQCCTLCMQHQVTSQRWAIKAPLFYMHYQVKRYRH